MNITSISIVNVKGIENQTFAIRLLPNKPNLLVAPNGFGKSSIATAFSSMNRNRMTLAINDCYQCDSQNQPKLELTIEDDSHNTQILTADNTQNGIREKFDITVIRNGLIPKATKHKIRGFTQASASLEVQSIPICMVPTKAVFAYRYSTAKSSFGVNGKVIPNITEQLKLLSICDVINQCDLSKFQGIRIQTSINNAKHKINQQNGSSDDISQWINNNLLDDLRSIDHLNTLASAMRSLNGISTEPQAFLAALQVIELFLNDKDAFNAAYEWLRYCGIKGKYESLLQEFHYNSWQWAEAKEMTTGNNKPKELRIIFPQADQLSNGQRDIITLVIQMHKALYSNVKKPLILVIDEVFDYLDDANLVAFQYYVTNLIEKYKKRNQILFPIILTHLDPGVFFDFCFNKHKIKTHYLQPHPNGKSKNSLKLIELRENNAVKERLETHWFHYHPENCEIDSSEWPKELSIDWKKSEIFHSSTERQLKHYLEGKPFDPLAVCFSIRIKIEYNVYSLLDSQSRIDFLNTRKTKEKLSYAAAKIDDIPEIFFLLGLIYNTNLHWKQGRDFIAPLVAKLSHPVIKSLVHSVTSQ